MLNGNKFLRLLGASALIAGTVAAAIPALPAFAAAVAAATSLTPTTLASGSTPAGYTGTFTPTTTGYTSIVITFPAGVTVPTTAQFVTKGQPTGNNGETFVATTAGQAVTLAVTGTPAGVPAEIVTFPLAEGFLNPANGGTPVAPTVSTNLDTVASFPAITYTTSTGIADQVTAASASPNTPGAVTAFTIVATTRADLTAGVDRIIVQLTVPSNQYLTGGGWTLPATISKSAIAISGTTCDQASGTDPGITPCGVTSTLGTQLLQVDPTVDLTAGTITMYVPDMAPNATGVASHNLSAGSITIAISALAGITNPASSSGSNYAVAVWDSTTSGGNVTASKLNALGATGYPTTAKAIGIPRVLQLSTIAGGRGTVVTVNGFGYTGPTVDLFLDNGATSGGVVLANANDGIQQGTEPTLASNIAVSGGKFTTTVTVGPNFTNGGQNWIQALDRGGPQGGSTRAITVPNFDLQPSLLSVSPLSNSVGDLETVQLQDFPALDACGTTTVGGVIGVLPAGIAQNNSSVAIQGIKIACAGDTGTTLGAAQAFGDGTLTVVSSQNFGSSEFINVTAGGTLEIEKITAINSATNVSVLRGQNGTTAVAHPTVGGSVVPTNVMLSNPSIAANGTATWTFNVPAGIISGPATVSIHTATSEGASNGNFSIQSATITVTPSTAVPNQQITISGSGFTGNTAIVVAGGFNGVSTGGGGAEANAPATVTDSGGNMIMQFKIVGGGAPTAPGQYTVNVTDASGTNTTGLATLTVPTPTLTISPNTGLGGSTITFSGTGMAASTTVTVNFPANGIGNNTTSSVQSDSSGNYSGTLTIPTSSNLTIPSTATVTATTGLPYNQTASALFNVPPAALTITPTSGAPGTSITVSGTSFPVFTSVNNLTIGGNGVALNGVNTDANGSFSTTILIPGLATGTATVIATVGTTTANTSITVTSQPASVLATTAFAALVNTQNLNIVTSFNYATGTYQSFVPALAGNSLVSVTPNSVIIVNMTKTTTVIVSGNSFTVQANVPTPLPVEAAVSISTQ